MIDWNAFTWDAFATLMTALVGLFAVSGAIYVGIKQAGIAKAQTEIAGRQTAILHRQAELEEVKLRADIFDRRFKVYEAAADAIMGVILIDDVTVNTKRRRRFGIATNQSQFLFRSGITEALKEIEVKLNDLGQVRSSLAQAKNSDVEFDMNFLNGQEGELIHWLAGRVNSLPDLFGDELKLTTDRGDQ